MFVFQYLVALFLSSSDLSTILFIPFILFVAGTGHLNHSVEIKLIHYLGFIPKHTV